jgi:hypothetical protein
MSFILFSMVLSCTYMFGYWMNAGEDMLGFPIVPREKSINVVVLASVHIVYSFRVEFAPSTSCRVVVILCFLLFHWKSGNIW